MGKLRDRDESAGVAAAFGENLMFKVTITNDAGQESIAYCESVDVRIDRAIEELPDDGGFCRRYAPCKEIITTVTMKNFAYTLGGLTSSVPADEAAGCWAGSAKPDCCCPACRALRGPKPGIYRREITASELAGAITAREALQMESRSVDLATVARQFRIPESLLAVTSKTEDAGACPDCYRGLSGQLEPCERHRIHNG